MLIKRYSKKKNPSYDEGYLNKGWCCMSRKETALKELASLEPMDAFSQLSIDELFFISGGQGASGEGGSGTTCGTSITTACSFSGGI